MSFDCASCKSHEVKAYYCGLLSMVIMVTLVIFLSCKTNARVFDAKSGHGPHFPPPAAAALPKPLTNVA